MQAGYAINLEIFIVGLLLVIPWHGPQVQRPLCPRDKAGLVRKVVLKRWVPILQKVGASLPIQCPLHPIRDLFHPQETHKKHEAPQWTCGFCGKAFYREAHLDSHMEKRHHEHISQHEDATCLADFCDVMRCDVISEKLRELEESSGGDEDIWPQQFLITTTRKANQDQAIMTTRPRSMMVSTSANRASSQTAAHKMDSSARSFAIDIEPGEVKKSLDPTECQDEVCQKAEEGHNASEQESNEPQQLPVHPAPSWSDTCNEEHLAELRVKCQFLIQQCVSGLVLNLTIDQVKGIETALHRAVCWYLTCERYWEAGAMEPPDFPWGIVTCLVLLLTLGVSFCYYVVWILCDESNACTPVCNEDSIFAHQPSLTYPIQDATPGRHQASACRAKYSATESESECRDSGFNEGAVLADVGDLAGNSYVDYDHRSSRSRHYSEDSRHCAAQQDYAHEERVYNYATTFTPNYEQRRLKRNRYNYLDDFDAYGQCDPDDPTDAGMSRERSDSFIYVSYPPEIKKKFLENR